MLPNQGETINIAAVVGEDLKLEMDHSVLSFSRIHPNVASGGAAGALHVQPLLGRTGTRVKLQVIKQANCQLKHKYKTL